MSNRVGRVLVVLALVVAGCGAPPEKPTPTPSSRSSNLSEADVDLFVQGGDIEGAAGIYVELAKAAPPPQRGEYLLRSIELLHEHSRNAGALARIETLDDGQLTPQQATRKQLLHAKLLMHSGAVDAAAALLPHPADVSNFDHQAQALALRADIQAARGQIAAAVVDRINLDPLLTDSESIHDNHRQIWSLLGAPSLLELTTLADLPHGQVFTGWVKLAEAVRGARLEQKSAGAAVNRWLRRYPAHPAADSFAGELLDTLSAARRYPHQIALLLPLRGRLGAVAEAIRDGFMSEYFNTHSSESKPDVRLYDVGGAPERFWDVFNLAMHDGAEFVVGPLSKALVNQMASRESLPVPVLSLNYADADVAVTPPAELFQFGLLPEDEASQAAEFMLSNGLRRAAAIVPQGEWGSRLIGAFQQTFERHGGTVIDHAVYESQQNDFSQPIQKLLTLQLSNNRRSVLQRALASELKFEPRRREDIDAIFIAATPKNARLLKPQLSFHHAADIPVYATSHAFTGTPDERADKDMNGLMYVDIPLVLDGAPEFVAVRSEIAESWSPATQRFIRLFALGVDAWRLIPQLPQLRGSPDLRLPGLTGDLYLDVDQRVHRRLRWGFFEQGIPQSLALPEPAPAVEPQEQVSASQ